MYAYSQRQGPCQDTLFFLPGSSPGDQAARKSSRGHKAGSWEIREGQCGEHSGEMVVGTTVHLFLQGPNELSMAEQPGADALGQAA